jgi:Flp pilus assembly CpaE family ATPase
VQEIARVVLALEAPDVAEEVLHFLDRSERARVVATAIDDRQLAEAARQLEPDAVVAQPRLAEGAGIHGPTLLALDTRESVASLRAAIRSGAGGFFLWPSDREQLAAAVGRAMVRPISGEPRGLVVAVHAARGGAGATFVATHLAAAVARRSTSCLLIDADPLYGDVSAVLGAPDDVHTLGDLLPLAGELTAQHLDKAAWEHPTGFGAILAPAPDRMSEVDGPGLVGVIEAAAAARDVVIVHLSRAIDPLARSVLTTADRLLEVLSLDVLSFRATTRALDALGPLGVEDRVSFVVNRATRGEIVPGDVQRVFGAAPIAVVPLDRSVGRAQDHGRLLSAKGRVGRAFDRIAAQLVDGSDARREAS